MIKKIFIVTILSLLSLLIVIPRVDAAAVFVDEPAANTGGLWHDYDGDNRVYVHMRYTDGSIVRETGSVTNSEYPSFDYSHDTYWESQRFEDNYEFPNTSNLKSDTIANPDPTVYDTFKVELIANMTVISGSSPTVKLVREYTDIAVNEITVDLVDYNDPTYGDIFPYIALTINGEEILSSKRVEENPYYDDQTFGVRMYWEKSNTAETIDPDAPVDPDNPVDPWEALPETTGNPVNPVGDWGRISNVSIIDNSISFDIEYKGTTYPISRFNVEGSLDFISKSNDILYYTDPDNGDRILYFNFGETLEDAILMTRTFSTVNNWKGEALWNLTQNEIKTTNKLNVYNYITDPDNDGNVYSYFYMPDVPIDNLISISTVLAYRTYDDGIFGIGGGFGDTQYKTVAAVQGESTSVNPSWVQKTYTGAYITGALATIGTFSGVIPGWGWAISIASFAIGGALNVSDINEWFAYDVNQIEHVIPNVALTNEINAFISSQDSTDSFNPDNDKLYKLHLANFGNADDVEVSNEESRVTQIVWETDGEIYVVDEEYINDYWGGPGTEVTDNNLTDNLIIYIGAVIVFILIYNSLNLSKKPGLMLIIIGGIVYVLYTWGMI